jgi:hypothetical protein
MSAAVSMNVSFGAQLESQKGQHQPIASSTITAFLPSEPVDLVLVRGRLGGFPRVRLLAAGHQLHSVGHECT